MVKDQGKGLYKETNESIATNMQGRKQTTLEKLKTWAEVEHILTNMVVPAIPIYVTVWTPIPSRQEILVSVG
jgi:hypothetical protein